MALPRELAQWNTQSKDKGYATARLQQGLVHPLRTSHGRKTSITLSWVLQNHPMGSNMPLLTGIRQCSHSSGAQRPHKKCLWGSRTGELQQILLCLKERQHAVRGTTGRDSPFCLESPAEEEMTWGREGRPATTLAPQRGLALLPSPG